MDPAVALGSYLGSRRSNVTRYSPLGLRLGLTLLLLSVNFSVSVTVVSTATVVNVNHGCR